MKRACISILIQRVSMTEVTTSFLCSSLFLCVLLWTRPAWRKRLIVGLGWASLRLLLMVIYRNEVKISNIFTSQASQAYWRYQSRTRLESYFVFRNVYNNCFGDCSLFSLCLF